MTKRLSTTSIFFAGWSIVAGAFTLIATWRAHANSIAIQAMVHVTPVPHLPLGNASVLLPLSSPFFAVVFFISSRLYDKSLRELLGLLQFGVAASAQCVAAISCILYKAAFSARDRTQFPISLTLLPTSFGALTSSSKAGLFRLKSSLLIAWC